MTVPSYQFLGFVLFAAVAVNFSERPSWRRPVLVLANIAFVLTFTRSLIQLMPFAGLLLAGFLSLKLMERYRSRAAFVPLMIGLIFCFCWLKRYAFIPHGLDLPFAYFTVGMSYVFFRVLHLIIDAYQDALPDRVSLLAYGSYTLNFTALVSGPIQLYPDYLEYEVRNPAKVDLPAALQAIGRIIVGFFKVSVISVALFSAQAASLARVSAGMPFGARTISAVLLLAIFPVYVYFNFSGYTDFVIGAARFLRLVLPENFNRPLTAVGVIDFWSRWHMTLSNWLKTYVYSPLLLSLMRRFPERNVLPYLGVFAYFVTFFLVGAWHGQTAKFLFFGLLTGLGISINKLYEILLSARLGTKRYRALCANAYYMAACRGLNFTWFSFTMLWFWSNWAQLAHLSSILKPAPIVAGAACLIVVAAALLSALHWLQENVGNLPLAAGALRSPYMRTAWYASLAAVTVSVTLVLNAPAPHIVYKAF